MCVVMLTIISFNTFSVEFSISKEEITALNAMHPGRRVKKVAKEVTKLVISLQKVSIAKSILYLKFIYIF